MMKNPILPVICAMFFSMGNAWASGACKVLVVVGMEDERALAAGPDADVVVGTANAAILKERLAAIRHPERYRAVFSFGVAGALDPSLQAGALLVSEQVFSQVEDDFQRKSDINWPVDHNLLLSASLQARRAQVPMQKGVFLGTDIEARDQSSEALRSLYESSGAHIVDNESHIAAQFAGEYGLPFLSVRAVSDSVHNPPPEAALLPLDPEDGSPDGWAIAKSLLKNPLQIPALIRTALHYRKALESLEHFRKAVGFEKLVGRGRSCGP